MERRTMRADAARAIAQVEEFAEALKRFMRKTYDDQELRRMRYTSWGRKNIDALKPESTDKR
jgi:hypothetical protein